MQSQDDTRILCAPPWSLARLWPHVGPLLLRGVIDADGDPEFTLDGLQVAAARIVDGRDQLWLAMSGNPPKVLAVFCTSILREEGGPPYLFVHTCAGGSVWDWGHLVAPALDAFAKAEGCISIRYEGRAAWTRILPAVAIEHPPEGVATFERVLQ
jgi:hypothetical protein